MNIFWSCHLIINRPPSDDGRHVCDIIDADYFGGEALLLHFLNLLPLQTLTFLLTILLDLKNVKYFDHKIFCLYSVSKNSQLSVCVICLHSHIPTFSLVLPGTPQVLLVTEYGSLPSEGVKDKIPCLSLSLRPTIKR